MLEFNDAEWVWIGVKPWRAHWGDKRPSEVVGACKGWGKTLGPPVKVG